MKTSYLAIEVLNNCVCIKKVTPDGLILPMGLTFKTLEESKQYANDNKLNIKKIGNSYEII